MKKFFVRISSLVLVLIMVGFYQSVTAIRVTESEARKAEVDKINAENRAAAMASVYKDGTFEGEADGFGGPITVEVTLKSGEITDIKIISHDNEDDAYFNTAVDVVDDMLSGQTTDVDTVTGATFSSTGIINAVDAALAEAEN